MSGGTDTALGSEVIKGMKGIDPQTGKEVALAATARTSRGR